MTGHGQHEGDGVFAGGNGIGFRRIDYGDTFFSSLSNVDAINAYAGTADDLQILCGINDLCGNLCPLFLCHRTNKLKT